MLGVNVRMILLLLFPIILFGGIGLSIYLDNKQSDKEHKEVLLESQVWLLSEQKKPNYYLRVKTKCDKEYRTPEFKPSTQVYYFFGGWDYIKNSSEMQAKDTVENIFKSGRFDLSGMYIPVCEIETVEIVQA